MATQATQRVMIAAQPAEVMSVIGDFAAYPDWVEALSSCEVLSQHRDGSAERVRFVVSTGIVQDDYVLTYTWAPNRLRVDWQLVSSQIMTEQTGSYTLAPKGRDTEVTYALSVELSMSMLAMFKRQAEKMIMDVALRSLKARVEAGG
jgi:ribosome-associated toxin RatA of RatAB toxin-antitoxin module